MLGAAPGSETPPGRHTALVFDDAPAGASALTSNGTAGPGESAGGLGDLFEAPPPRVDADLAAGIARVVFGVDGRATLLSGERDVTARIVEAPTTGSAGRAWILKVVHPDEPLEVTDLQVAVLSHLAAVAPEVPVPRLHPATRGGERASLPDGRSSAVRLVTEVSGSPMSRAASLGDSVSPQLAGELGALLARTDRALAALRHPAEDIPLLWDTTGFLLRPQPYATLVAAEPDLAEQLGSLRERVAPRLTGHPRQLVHNDANPHNVFVGDHGTLTGLIDLGDMVRAPRVQDLAVALAYLIAPGPHPLAAAEAAVAGYAQVEALTAGELALLPDLMAARMAMAMAITRWRARRHPENAPYILRNHETTRAGLAELARLGPDLVADRLATAAARTPEGRP